MAETLAETVWESNMWVSTAQSIKSKNGLYFDSAIKHKNGLYFDSAIKHKNGRYFDSAIKNKNGLYFDSAIKHKNGRYLNNYRPKLKKVLKLFLLNFGAEKLDLTVRFLSEQFDQIKNKLFIF